jgi:serine/threonine protein kinase
MNLEANVEIGDFRIERRLGAGGMGIVYLARQLSLNRPVAMKVLGSALTDQTDIARFQREAQAIAKLNHRGIAGVYFVGQDRDVCYIAMEYIDGMSLRELTTRLSSSVHHGRSIDDILHETSRGGEAPELRFDDPTLTFVPVPSGDVRPANTEDLVQAKARLMSSPGYIRRCCEIVRDAALALAHAHERGVIHRDIKPENILLDREGKPHLIDFGLARFYEDVTLTNTGALVGTPMYMSPEQVTGRLKIDHRTDIYSLGLVLYEMLTLAKPFSSPTREGILRQIVTKAILPVGWKNKGVPRDLESVVHKSLARDPDCRYQTGIEFCADIASFMESASVKAGRYLYQFDEREIAAERPSAVVTCAVLFILYAVFGMVAGLLNFAFDYPSEVTYLKPAVSLLLLTVSLLAFSSLRGLLRGKPFSRQTAIACCIGSYMIAGVLIFFLFRTIRQDARDLAESAVQYSALVNQFLLCGMYAAFLAAPSILTHVVLTRPTIRAWFRHAERMRAEHSAGSAVH